MSGLAVIAYLSIGALCGAHAFEAVRADNWTAVHAYLLCALLAGLLALKWAHP